MKDDCQKIIEKLAIYSFYRLENDIYDKIIAIEMIEAVGHEYLPQFFETLRDRLRPGGKVYLQVYTCIIIYFFLFK